MNRVSSSAIYDYDFMDQIGVGAFGCVYRARHKLTNTIVAVKVMKKKSSKSSGNNPWQEYKTMKRLVHHPNIIHLFEGFTGPTKELYFVMEFMNGGNLYQYLEEKRDKGEKLNEMELRPVLRQILNALESIHEQGYFHRDLKPENLLVNTDHGDNGSTQLTIKLADFGLARELKSKTPYTDYVSTRWYRSPEVLLKSTTYSSSVDIWAVGVIMAELLTLHPLFPGQSEIDQLFRICEVIGSPGPDSTASTLLSSSSPSKKKKIRNTGFSRKKSESALSTHDPVTSTNTSSHNNTTTSLQGDGGEWKDGIKLAQKLGFQFPQIQPKGLATVLPTASNLMIDLMRRLLLFDPKKRLSARDALGHPFFIDTLITAPTTPTTITTANRPNSEQLQLPTVSTRTKTTRAISMVNFSKSLPSEHLPSFLDPLSFIPLSLEETKLDGPATEPYTTMATQGDNDDDPNSVKDKRQRHSTSVMNISSMDSFFHLDKHNISFGTNLEVSLGSTVDPTICDLGDKYTEMHLKDINKTDETEHWLSTNECKLDHQYGNAEVMDSPSINYRSKERHNRHDSLDLLDTLAIPSVTLNLRPSFSSPLNHMDHFQQQRQSQKQHPHQLPTGKQKKSSTSFTHFFGLRKKPRQTTTPQQQDSSRKISTTNKDHQNKQSSLGSTPSHITSSLSTKLRSNPTTATTGGIPRTESFSSLIKQITSSSTSIRPNLNTTSPKKSTIHQSAENEQNEPRHKLLQRRSPSISLLSTYYHDSESLKEKSSPRNFWSRKHPQPIEDTL